MPFGYLLILHVLRRKIQKFQKRAFFHHRSGWNLLDSEAPDRCWLSSIVCVTVVLPQFWSELKFNPSSTQIVPFSSSFILFSILSFTCLWFKVCIENSKIIRIQLTRTHKKLIIFLLQKLKGKPWLNLTLTLKKQVFLHLCFYFLMTIFCKN